MSKQLDILNGSIWDKALKFAIPLALTGMLQQIFSATDVAVLGRFVGAEAMAGVGSNAPFVSLLINGFVGVAIGANVVIANYIGQGDEKKVEKATHTAWMLAVISGLIVAVFGRLAIGPAMNILGVPSEVESYSRMYLAIYFAGAPFIMLYNFEAAIFRSVGKTQIPLIALTCGGVLNVLCDIFLVVKLGMSADGVAYATVLANVVSSMILFVCLLKEKSMIRINIRKLSIDKAIMIRILKIGVPSGVQSMVFSISNLCVQSAINSLGPAAMAAGSASFNIEIFAYYIINAFGQTVVTFAGQSYGAGNKKRVRDSLKQITILSEIVTIVVMMLILVFLNQLCGLFSKDPEIMALSAVRVKCLIYFEWMNVFMENLSSVLRGIGKSLGPAIITLVSVCGTRIVWVYTIFAQTKSWLVLSSVYPISWAICVTILAVLYVKTRRKILC